MKWTKSTCRAVISAGDSGDRGFSLIEATLALMILLVISSWLFSLLAETERSASYNTEVQAVLSNSRISMDTVLSYIRQAGNDPQGIGFQGVTIVGPSEVRLLSDLTGSDALDPNRGDPDGDTTDIGEDVTIRHNTSDRSIEVVAPNGAVQTIANYVDAFAMQYLDSMGIATTLGSDVRKIRITITCASAHGHPQTHKTYGMTMSSDVQLGTRQ